jgi:cytochrome c oxidase subunit 4
MNEHEHAAHGAGHDPHPPGDHGHGHEDHGGLMKYIYVFIALCVLTTMSFLTYTDYWRDHFDIRAGWFLMMAVSCSKAMLVILFFMHVKYEANWKYVLTIPASIMSIFLVLALVPDVGLRNQEAVGGRNVAEERLEHMAAPEDVKAMVAAEE